MPVKRKLNKKRTKVPRNVKINSKSSKRASQKKRGRKMSKRQRGGGGCPTHIKQVEPKDKADVPYDKNCRCKDNSYYNRYGIIEKKPLLIEGNPRPCKSCNVTKDQGEKVDCYTFSDLRLK